MKYTRELKIGLVLIVAIFLLYFGMNFLKGLNIFSPMRTYVGQFENLNSLETSSPVYIRGYKVGQVSQINYDFTRPDPFTVSVVINKDIRLPKGSEMTLIADGLLGGAAIELRLAQAEEFYQPDDTIPTAIEGGLLDQLQNGMLADLNHTINDIDSIVLILKGQVEGDHVKNILANADNAIQDLTVTSNKLKKIVNTDVPPIVNDAKVVIADAKSTMAHVNSISTKIDTLDIEGMAGKIDSTIYNIQQITQAANSTDGTLGLLLNDKTMYNKINQTIVSADTLITDIKKNPKRYINISIFGGK